MLITRRSSCFQKRHGTDLKERQLVQVPLVPLVSKSSESRQTVLVRPRYQVKRKETFKPVPHPSIMLTNARSIRNKFDEFLLRFKSVKPGLAIVSESWLDCTTDSTWLEISGYQILRKDRCSNGGGILAYCSNDYHVLVCDCIHYSARNPSLKSEFLTFIIDSTILVICLYHPYWGSSHFHDIVIDLLINIVAHGKSHHSISSVILCGDFNGLAGQTSYINALLGTDSLFNFETRSNVQLDFVLTDCKRAYADSQLLPPLARSDHNVIYCPAVKVHPRPQIRKVQFRKKLPASSFRFRDALVDSKISENILKVSGVEEATLLLTEGLRHLYNIFFPLRTIRIRDDDKPWVKPSLKLLINARDRAYAEKKHLKYVRLREAVIKHVRDLKNEYLRSFNHSSNSSSNWKAINELLHRKKKPSSPNVNDLALIFSQTFIPSNTDDVSRLIESLPSASSLSVTEQEVYDVMVRLKKGSPGPDELPFWILRDYAFILSPAVQHVINLSLSTGMVPKCLKKANITPIPKIDRPGIADYRPISLLSVVSKVMEKLVLKKWLYQSVTPIGPTQFAFIPRIGQGTEVALAYIVHHILSFLDAPGAVRLLMLDYQKAFDTIPHQVILQSLVDKNAPKELLRWIYSYLSSREQRVKCNGNVSGWFSATSGVPQGGVLAPLLFASAMDSLEAKYANTLLVKFADDITALHFIRKDEDDNLQSEFNHILSWSSEHGMRLNFVKTKVMNFKTKKNINIEELRDVTTSTVIEEVSSSKLLGVMLDNKINWECHLQYILSKARRRIYLLHSIKQVSTHNSRLLRIVYMTMIRPILSYAYSSWCNITVTRFNHLIRLEKRLCKMFDFFVCEDIKHFCHRSSQQLASKAISEGHPLNFIYESEERRFSERIGKSNRPLRARTVRFKNSFIRFA